MAKRPIYRLQALLRLKEREKHQAEVALARAFTALREAQEREKKLREEKERIVAAWLRKQHEMSEEMRGGGTVFDGNVFLNYLRKLKEDEEKKAEEIEEQQEKVMECQEMIVRRRREYIDASKALQVMEKHKALWWKKVMQEISRAEEKQFDELCTTIHTLKGWRGEGGDDAQAMAH
ncbi:MAG: hypothetical protein HYV02_02445 [Deltaproteobacteria bacterium]|nr:hypothetical protein [Deltaproteobacteria bacterium]